jgi:hypothetical protein
MYVSDPLCLKRRSLLDMFRDTTLRDMLAVIYFLGLLFGTEDGSSILLRNVGVF